MRVYKDDEVIAPEARGASVAIGNFDGVHRGHQAVIAKAKAKANAKASAEPGGTGILTFEPHPRAYFRPHEPPFRLTPLPTKLRLASLLGVDVVFVLTFSETLAALTADAFINEVLVKRLGVRHVAIGADFCFGRGRGGNAALLAARGAAAGFGVSVVSPVHDADTQRYSSERVRTLLHGGRPDRATAILGHLWEIEGRVERGARLGATIGFPTANVALGEYLRPARGVYAVRAGVVAGVVAGVIDGGGTRWVDAVANFGVRPTVDGGEERLEVHLLDFEGDLYGSVLRVAFVERLRAEQAFDGIEALRAQIGRDAEEARAVLAARRIRAGAIVGAPPQ